MAIDQLTTSAVRRIFEEETVAQGGHVKDAFDDGRRLFLRSILPPVREVRPDDMVNPGVAMRATEEDVWIHPYLFRQVCTNGAIMAHSIESRHIRIATLSAADDAEWTLRAAIRDCSTQEVFATSASEMRSTVDREADLAITMMSFMGRMGAGEDSRVITDILEQYFNSGDHSAFGWMNAITAVARDTENPEMRWRLEEAGGGVPAALRDRPLMPFSHAEAMVFGRELVGAA